MRIVERERTHQPSATPDEGQAIIPEASRRGRRRRVGTVVLLAALLALAGSLVALLGGGGRVPPSVARQPGPEDSAGLLPTGPLVTLDLAGDLTVGPAGSLYVAAPQQHRILVKLPDGRFRVVAGDGRNGSLGNRGPALDAELSDPYDLTFGPNGDLYFVDSGRVKVINPAGSLATVAGDGMGAKGTPGQSSPAIPDGSPALSVSLGPRPHIALAVSGQLYLATSTQLLRLTNTGTLKTLTARRGSFGPPLPSTLDVNLFAIALDAHGDLDIAGFNGWGVWHVAHNGVATCLGYARASGGTLPLLVRGPDGAVYVGDGTGILRLAGTKLMEAYNLDVTVRGESFWPTSFAFGRDGVLYADEIPGGGGFEAHQQLLSFHAGRVQLLWEQENPTSRNIR
jgi:hypothetical protein